MEADGYVLALYLISGAMGIGCALLAGSSLPARIICLASGIALVAWGANAYVVGEWYLDGPLLLMVPLLLGGYALRTVQARIRRTELATAASVASSAPVSTGSGPGGIERRRAGRRRLAGEIGDTPVNVVPPAHDPWAALYAASERQQLRAEAQAAACSADPYLT